MRLEDRLKLMQSIPMQNYVHIEHSAVFLYFQLKRIEQESDAVNL